MASLQHDNTFVTKVIDEFESKLAKPRLSNIHKDRVIQELVFDETLTNEIGGNDYSERYVESSRKRSREGELVTTKTRVIKLENRIFELETENRRNKIDLEKRIEELKAEKWKEKESYEEMRFEVDKILERETRIRSELIECRKELKTKTKLYETTISDLTKERDDLKNELSEQMIHAKESILALESELESERTEKNSLKQECEVLLDRVDANSAKSADFLNETLAKEEAELRANEAERRLKELESEISKSSGDRKLVKILEKELLHLPELEKENRTLKEENRVHRMRDENLMLLREELDTLKKKLERSENLYGELQKCQLENEDLKRKLQSWDMFLSIVDPSETKSPHNVAKVISRLQQQETVLMEKVGVLTTNNKTLETSKSEIEAELKKCREDLHKQAMTMKQSVDQIRHLQRKFLLVSKERDFCRKLVENYEKETTVVISGQDDERIQRLESLVQGYKKAVENLESELDSARQQLAKFGRSCSGVEVEEERLKMEQEIKDLKAKVLSYEDRIRQAVEEKAAFQLQIEYLTLKNEINPQKTRVVHLSSNPVAWERQKRANELEDLKKENENLRHRLKIVQEDGGAIEDLTIRVGEKLKEVPSSKEFEELKDQLSSAELKNKRLMEAFRKVSIDFREITYTLLGYKLEFQCNNQYKLSSMYAESADDYILFEKAESGEIRLLETPFSSAIVDKIDVYLHTYHSIPAFLSNLTLELFNSQTVLPSTSSMEYTVE